MTIVVRSVSKTYWRGRQSITALQNVSFEVSQGEQVGRPSVLQLEVNTDNEVFVGGEVIELGSGILNL